MAHVDCPRKPYVTAHTLQRARISGWVARLGNGRVTNPVFGRLRIGESPWQEFPIVVEQPGVVKALEGAFDVRDARGFSMYIDLPPLTAPLPLELEFSDGAVVASAGRFEIAPEPDLGLLDTFTADPEPMRRLALEHLRGRGLEFGAFHSPLRVSSSCRMEYADHYLTEELVELFPEIARDYGDCIVHVDHRIDINRSDLSELAPHEFDFFVINGVMEHLANPIRFLENVARIMRPGASLFIAVPDRDYAFDSRRELTTFDHLWQEHLDGVLEPSDEHLVDYLEGLAMPIPDDPAEREALFESHRAHTYHVHVWDEGSFDAFVNAANERLSLRLERVGWCGPREGEGNIIAVLRKLPA